MQDPYGKEINDELLFLESSKSDLLQKHGPHDARYLYFMSNCYNPRMDKIRDYVQLGVYPTENSSVF